MAERTVPVEDAGAVDLPSHPYKFVKPARTSPVGDAGAADLPPRPYTPVKPIRTSPVEDAGAADLPPHPYSKLYKPKTIRVSAHERTVPQPKSPEPEPEPPTRPSPEPEKGRRMSAWTRMVDMELTDEEKLDAIMPMPMPDRPDYPFGLRICLTEKELAKLDLDDDCEVGDMIDIRAMAKVTSCSKNDGPNGPTCRIELQIENMAIENESTEEMDGC